MHADFSVELGHDDPVLEIPWASEDHSVRYYDLKTNPELLSRIPEAAAHPELKTFLARMNAPSSPFETAKCDVWESRDITPEEEIFGADRKFASYIDLIFVDEAARGSFEKHEEFAKNLCLLLGRAPDISAKIELVIRRCYYRQQRNGRQDESNRINSDRISKDVKQGMPDYQAIPLGQKTTTGHEKEQYPSEQSYVRADHIESSSRLDASGEPDLEASFKSASSHDSGVSFKSERSQAPGTSFNSQDTSSLIPLDVNGAYHLNDSNIVSCGPSAFLSESTAPFNEGSAVVTGFYFTAYVIGFGDDDLRSYPRWAIAISLLQHAVAQSVHMKCV